LPVVDWHGWLFVNAGADAVPFGEYVGALEGRSSRPYAPRISLAARHDYEVRANWKVIVENYKNVTIVPIFTPNCVRVAADSGANYDLPAPGSAARWTCGRTPRPCPWTAARAASSCRASTGGACSIWRCARTCCSPLHPDY